MTEQFDYTPAHWNRLSRSARRMDENVVEIHNATNAVGKMMLNLIILAIFLLMFLHLFSISGDRVIPKRSSSFETFKELLERRYIFITDLHTALIPRRQSQIEFYQSEIEWHKKQDPSFDETKAEPLQPYEEFYDSYAKNLGRTPLQRLNTTIGSLGLVPFFIYLFLFVPVRLLMPNSNGIRLDSNRRVVYVRDWAGYSARRFLGLADMRPRKKRDRVDVLDRLHFTTKLHVERAVSPRLVYINNLYKFVYPGKKPPMVYLTDNGTGHGLTQRFPLGSYPMRKNQAEEIAQFIEDFFAHPNPGEWTKNLRYRYPLWGDLPAWLIRVNLWPFKGYNKTKTEAQIDECLKEIDMA